MKNRIISKVLSSIDKDIFNNESENYQTINIRPGDKLASMLYLLSKLSNSSPSEILTAAISEKLADFVLADSSHYPILMDFLENGEERFPVKNSALSILEKKGVVKLNCLSIDRLFNRGSVKPDGESEE